MGQLHDSIRVPKEKGLPHPPQISTGESTSQKADRKATVVAASIDEIRGHIGVLGHHLPGLRRARDHYSAEKAKLVGAASRIKAPGMMQRVEIQ